jgi:hypothetical protein
VLHLTKLEYINLLISYMYHDNPHIDQKQKKYWQKFHVNLYMHNKKQMINNTWQKFSK